MKKIIVLLLTLIMIAGCGSRQSYGGSEKEYNYSPGADSGYVMDEGYDANISNYNVQTDSSGNVSYAEEFKKEEKLVYTGTITMEAKNYDDFSTELNGIINKYQGIIQAMREQTNSYGAYSRTLTLTLRIPAEDFNNFIDDLRNGSGSVTDVNTRVDNITTPYNNNEIEIEALETQHTRLLELLSDASSLEDIIKLEERISQIEIRLTQLKQYRNQMDQDVAYSTITLYVNEVKEYTEISYWQKLATAFGNAWIRFVDNLGYFLIDVVYAIPTLVVLVVLYFVFRKPLGGLISRLISGKKTKKSEQVHTDTDKEEDK